jgi:membrane-bound ClpP family serine protease
VLPAIERAGGSATNYTAMIALAADEILMEEHAVLGPVDPQLGEYPASSLVKLAEKHYSKSRGHNRNCKRLNRCSINHPRNALQI